MKNEEFYRTLLALGCSHTDAINRILKGYVDRDKVQKGTDTRDVLMEWDGEEKK